jgi:hypothetical protein
MISWGIWEGKPSLATQLLTDFIRYRLDAAILQKPQLVVKPGYFPSIVTVVITSGRGHLELSSTAVGIECEIKYYTRVRHLTLAEYPRAARSFSTEGQR